VIAYPQRGLVAKIKGILMGMVQEMCVNVTGMEIMMARLSGQTKH
jgi:hypothetical protein